jgi:hypothetical protein
MWRPALICVLMMLAQASLAQVYECIDAKGAKQFAQFCPPGTVKQRQVLKEGDASGGAASSGAAPKSIEAQDLEYRKRLLERQDADIKAAQDKSQAEEFERNCVEARATLQSVLDGARMERPDPVTGERVRFGDDELAEEAERQRKAVAQWCK